MTFALYALLGDETPTVTIESLASGLKSFFRNEENFSLEFESLPFAKNRCLDLRWGEWLVRVNYEEGENVAQDSEFISKTVGSATPYDVSKIDKRIRVVFSSDDTQEYTNQIIFVMDFLREITATIIYDPQQRDLVR